MHCSKSLQGSKSAITMLPVSIELALTLFLLTQNFLRYSFHLFHLFILHFTYKFFIHFYFINAFFDWCFRLWFVSGRHYSLIVNFFSLLIEVDFRNKDFNQFRPKMLATNWNLNLYIVLYIRKIFLSSQISTFKFNLSKKSRKQSRSVHCFQDKCFFICKLSHIYFTPLLSI